MKRDIFVSVVFVVEDYRLEVLEVLAATNERFQAEYANYELLIVDNAGRGSIDPQLAHAVTSLPCVRILRLSQHVSPDSAAFAGLENAIGDYVVLADPQFDPIEDLVEMLSVARAGNDVVEAESTLLPPRTFRSVIRRGFLSYVRFAFRLTLSERATGLVAMSRRAVNAVTASGRFHRYLAIQLRVVGFAIERYPYTPRGVPNTRAAIFSAREALDIVSSHSTHALRTVSILGILFAIGSSVIAVVRAVAGAHDRGTNSVQVSLTVLGAAIVSSVHGEYLGRVLSEARRDPSYFIAEEIESDVLILDPTKRNIVD